MKKIKAAEVLGSSTVILTDKTGTITENNMQVVSVFPENNRIQVIKSALAALTDISLSSTDKAILDADRLKILQESDIVMMFDIIYPYFVIVTMTIAIVSSTVFLQQAYSSAKLCNNNNSRGNCIIHHQQIHSIASRKGSQKYKEPFIFPIHFP